MDKITFTNTLTHKKEGFEPIAAPSVSLYSCGPTVYSRPHIGNWRAYLFVDLLKRVLKMNGLQVTHIMNITDVGHLTGDETDTGEDKLQKAATLERKTAWEIAKEYEGWFKKDAADLNIEPPTKYVRATEHIAEQIAFVKILEKKKFTYKLPDGIYFDTSKLKKYGELTPIDVTALKEGARVKKIAGRKNPTDFALWKFSPKNKQRDMEWESPWGKGFPGWHIECSAMSEKYLGVPFDIHTGGIDHIPVHHTNEIAQTRAANGKLLANLWMHNEHLKLGDAKMAKSAGEVLTLDTLREHNIHPLAFRYYCLNTHYRQAIEFSWEGLEAAQSAYDKLLRRVEELEPPKIGCAELEKQFRNALNDDLNTPKGLAVLWDVLKSKNPSSAIHASVLMMDDVLGLGLREHEVEELPESIRALLIEREAAREDQDFTSSDMLREQIEAEGYLVEDTPEGVKVRKK